MDYQKLTNLLKVVAEPNRLKILEMLSCGEMCACNILDHFDFEAVDITKELPKDLKIETAQEGFIQLLPGIHPCDGFFIGKLRRK